MTLTHSNNSRRYAANACDEAGARLAGTTRAVVALSHEDHQRLHARLEHLVPGASSSSEVLEDVLPAYGEADLDMVWAAVVDYAHEHDREIARLRETHVGDKRPLPVLTDPALVVVLERLDHDAYRLRRSWAQTRDLRELRRLANLWGVRLEA